MVMDTFNMNVACYTLFERKLNFRCGQSQMKVSGVFEPLLYLCYGMGIWYCTITREKLFGKAKRREKAPPSSDSKDVQLCCTKNTQTLGTYGATVLPTVRTLQTLIHWYGPPRCHRIQHPWDKWNLVTTLALDKHFSPHLECCITNWTVTWLSFLVTTQPCQPLCGPLTQLGGAPHHLCSSMTDLSFCTAAKGRLFGTQDL
eukprot:PhF_6_TR31551/c0_g1_i1/m.46588